MILYTVVMTDGTKCMGEYVGAQDGLLYLATADEVIRIEQRQIAAMAVIDRRAQ